MPASFGPSRSSRGRSKNMARRSTFTMKSSITAMWLRTEGAGRPVRREPGRGPAWRGDDFQRSRRLACRRAEASGASLPVFDATCPLVAKVQAQATATSKRAAPDSHRPCRTSRGRRHNGRVAAPVHLVQSLDGRGRARACRYTPLAYVTQTTLSVDDTKAIIAALKRRFTNIVGPETRDICYATQNRQTAVRDLSKLVDVVLVVGAKNSSNSNRLREIGAEADVPSYLIADKANLTSVLCVRARHNWPDRRSFGAGGSGRRGNRSFARVGAAGRRASARC